MDHPSDKCRVTRCQPRRSTALFVALAPLLVLSATSPAAATPPPPRRKGSRGCSDHIL